jgi:hypothetical protein
LTHAKIALRASARVAKCLRPSSFFSVANHDSATAFIEAVADAADRRLDPGLGEPVGVTDRGVLHPGVGVVDQPLGGAVPAALIDGLLEGVQRQVGAQVAGGAPPYDAAGERVDDEPDVDKPCPRCDLRQI